MVILAPLAELPVSPVLTMLVGARRKAADEREIEVYGCM